MYRFYPAGIIILLLSAGWAQQSAAQTSVTRLKGQARFYENFRGIQPADSTIYFYSGANGSGQDTTIPYVSDIKDSSRRTYWIKNGAYALRIQNTRYLPGTVQPDTIETLEYDDAAQAWYVRSLQTFAYDNKLRDTLSIYYLRSNPAYPPQFYSGYKYVYDVNDRLIARHQLRKDNNVISASSTDSFFYDQAGILVCKLYAQYQHGTGEMRNMDMDSFFYDNTGLPATDIRYYRSGNDWIISFKSEHYHDTAGRITGTIRNAKDGPSWRYIGFDSTSYDSQGYITQKWSYMKKTTRWEYGPQLRYSYDTAHRLTAISVYQWDNVYWVKGHPDAYDEAFYYETYTEAPPSLSAMAGGDRISSAIRVYPNPANSLLNISIPPLDKDGQAMIYDISGRLVRSMPVPARLGSLVLPLYNLDEGIYLLKIAGDGREWTERFRISN